MNSLKSILPPGGLLSLDSGEALFESGATGSVWMLEAGALRLDRVDRGAAQFSQIVLSGDLVGLEVLASHRYGYTARAIVPCELRPRLLPTDDERRLALVAGLMQWQRRSSDLIVLRSGSAQDRLKHLLVLLTPEGAAPGGHGAHCALPTIRDMAAIIDTAPETVSRIFANLKRARIVDGRRRQGASYSLAHLREADWPVGMTRSNGLLRLALAQA